MGTLLLILATGFFFYQLAMRRKAQVGGDRNFSIWRGNELLFWPYVKRKLHTHPVLRLQPFLLGFTSGILLGVILLLNIAIAMLLIFSVAFLFNEHRQAGGILLAPLLLGFPWSKFLSTPFSNPLLITAAGYAINIGLLGLGWGIYLAVSSRIKGGEP